MYENRPDPGSGKATLKKPPYKQTCIVMTILSLSFCSEAVTIEHENEHYMSNPVALVMLFLLIILTEYKGRKFLFATLFLLSIISSTTQLFPELQVISHSAQATVRGATVALTALVMCEYCEPRLRMVHLITNSVILRVSYWVTIECSNLYTGFGEYLQYFKIVLAVGCFGFVLTWPESPYWLASKRRFKESKEAFLAVRSSSVDEMQALTDATPRRSSPKMIYAPALMALPVLLMFSMEVNDLEKGFLNEFINIGSGRIVLYLITNVVSASIAVFFLQKKPRRKLVISYCLICIACFVLTYLWEMYLTVYVTEGIRFLFNVITYLFFYIVIVFGAPTLYFPVVLEVVPRRHVSLFTAATGVPYLVFAFVHTLFDNFIYVDGKVFIMLYVAISSIMAYFHLPEAKDKSLLEIEREY